MFGLVVAGRPVDAAPQTITQTQYVFRIQPTPSFHHIVVFMLPGNTLPQGTAASVYIQIPPSDFRFLGAIGPGKESAIFKVSGVGVSAEADGDVDAMSEDVAAQPASGSGDIAVGISIEPAEQVDSQLATLKAQASSSNALVKATAKPGSNVSTKQLAKNIIGNAFDFLASFGSDTVPLKAFQDWWTKFEKKVDLDPSFLERARDG